MIPNRLIALRSDANVSHHAYCGRFQFLLFRARPVGVSRATFRDKILRNRLAEFVHGTSVLELGCGEGHLTQVIFDDARSVTGVNISEIAISRAKALNLPNAKFEVGDFLTTRSRDTTSLQRLSASTISRRPSKANSLSGARALAKAIYCVRADHR
jgi:SAM-dependent methyltransferase